MKTGSLLSTMTVILALMTSFGGCEKTGPPPLKNTPETAPPPAKKTPTPGVENNWDPKTGRGSIKMVNRRGDRIEVGLHEGFSGYTGGLVLGGLNGPAYRVRPFDAPEDAPPLAIWCAQDESIFDRSRDLEFTYGWSENFGRGADGVALEYIGGKVLRQSNDSVLLVSRNASVPYSITRWLLARADGTLAFKVLVTNRGDEPAVFDFWTGEDPWVGVYGTSEGDVGWYRDTLVTRESEIAIDGKTRCLGIADLKREKGAGGIVVAANSFCISPNTTPPDHAFFANSFAHESADLDTTRLLDSKTLTAFNLGWKNVELAHDQSFEVSYALGMILPDGSTTTEEDSGTGRKIGFAPPEIAGDVWEELAEGSKKTPDFPPTSDDHLRFHRERVTMTVLDDGSGVKIRGSYVFKNETDRPLHKQIYFPFHVDEDHPYPYKIRVSTAPGFRRLKDGILFPLSVHGNSEKEIDITYSQKSGDGSATYIVTSARSWGRPLARARLEVVAPEGIKIEDISYPMSPAPREDGRGKEQTLFTVIEDFFPQKEFIVRWKQ